MTGTQPLFSWGISKIQVDCDLLLSLSDISVFALIFGSGTLLIRPIRTHATVRCYQLWALPLNLSFATYDVSYLGFLFLRFFLSKQGVELLFLRGCLSRCRIAVKKHHHHSHSHKGKSLTRTCLQFLNFSAFSSLQGEWWHADRHGVWETPESSPSRSTGSKKSKRYWAWLGLLKISNPTCSDTLPQKRPYLLQQSVPSKPKIVPLPEYQAFRFKYVRLMGAILIQPSQGNIHYIKQGNVRRTFGSMLHIQKYAQIGVTNSLCDFFWENYWIFLKEIKIEF